MRVHTGERPFECPHPSCNYTASQSGSIRSHKERWHSSMRAFACNLCAYTAKTDADLKKHTGRHWSGPPDGCVRKQTPHHDADI